MKSNRASYDCVVIGGGHNGLVTAAYLAKAGKSVCVLERRHVLGGCAVTEAVVARIPRVDGGLRDQPVPAGDHPRSAIEAIWLDDPAPQSLVVHASAGRPLVADGPRHGSTTSARSPSSAISDAERYPEYNNLLERVAQELEPVLSKSAPDPLPLPQEWRKIGVAKRLRDTGKAVGAVQRHGRSWAKIFRRRSNC